MAFVPTGCSNSPYITRLANCLSRNAPTISSDEPHFLYAEKERVEKAIAALEQLQANSSDTAVKPKRPGRKSMGEEERRKVSARMKRFWAEHKEK
jgi:hypothetical protein